jgi:hypothetical protein
MSEPGVDVMARFVGPENVQRGRDYLEQLDPALHRYIIDFVQVAVYAGFPNAWNASATMKQSLDGFTSEGGADS